MKIRLGLDLDGQHGEVPAPQLDEISVGPLGMLNILETQLGLLRLETPQGERVMQYRDGLRRIDSTTRFFHASLAADELGTSATLLEWRDIWHLHGWQSGPPAPETPFSQRLKDMREVEAAVPGALAPCVGERLHAIHCALRTQKLRLETLTLCEPLESWPLAWQNVLRRLPLSEQVVFGGHAAADSMLGQLQAALLALTAGESPAPLRWQDDGSLKIVRAETTLLAGNWLASIAGLATQDRLLVAPEPGMLDELLVAAGQPRQGFRESSALRPPLQVLPLVLAQLWQPVDVHALLEFLTHPVCPVRDSRVRSRLAERLAETPGVCHGAEWEGFLDRLQGDFANTGLDWSAVRASIQLWLEHERYTTKTGAPLAAVVTRLELLEKYFGGRLGNAAEPALASAFASALGQTAACRKALEGLVRAGETHVRPTQLHGIVTEATANGTPHPGLGPETGAWRTITRPGAAVEAADQVLWWQMNTPALPGSWPWSAAEQIALTEAGVQLPAPEATLRHEARCWQRPLLAARQQLCLILPRAGVEAHPVWLLIQSLFHKDHPPGIVELESTLRDTQLTAQAHHPLPELRRWWALPDGIAIPQRKEESFSSLESFLFNPFQWVLRYPARLKPSSVLNVKDGMTLLGTLAHRMVELHFLQADALSQQEADFHTWFDAQFEVLIDEEGAVLRMPGRRAELESFQRRLRGSMLQLRSDLMAADVVSVAPELRVSGSFDGGALMGLCDLLVTRKDGEQAIVDMKWTGSSKWPDKLANNAHLQLVLYGELLHQQTGRWPQLAYYVIDTASLLATDSHFFPTARVISRKKHVAGEGPAHLWQRFLVTWQWRRDQLDLGDIEVALAEDPDSTAPDDGMKLEILNPDYNDYLALAGWGEDQ